MTALGDPGQGGTTAPLHAGETLDGVLGGAVRVVQPQRGYRFALDSVLLARFASEKPVGRAIDLGCGSGVVGLCLVALGGAREVVGIDLQAEMVDRARRGALHSGLGGRARFDTADLRRVREFASPQSFELAVSNPPYRAIASGRMSQDASAALSRHEVGCTASDVAAAAGYLLGTGGEFCAVYPAGRLAALLAGCRQSGLEPKSLRLVHPRPEARATLALVRCSRGGGEGLEIRPPLFLHAPGARYSPEAERLLGSP